MYKTNKDIMICGCPDYALEILKDAYKKIKYF